MHSTYNSFIFFHLFSCFFIFFSFSFHFLFIFIFFLFSFHVLSIFFPRASERRLLLKVEVCLYIFTCSHLHHIFIPLHHHWSRGGAVAVTVAATVGVAVAVVPVALLLLLFLSSFSSSSSSSSTSASSSFSSFLTLCLRFEQSERVQNIEQMEYSRNYAYNVQ